MDYDKVGMKSIAVNYFKELFSESGVAGLPRYWPNLFPQIDQRISSGLNDEISSEEIKEAVSSIGGLKGFWSRWLSSIIFLEVLGCLWGGYYYYG